MIYVEYNGWGGFKTLSSMIQFSYLLLAPCNFFVLTCISSNPDHQIFIKLISLKTVTLKLNLAITIKEFLLLEIFRPLLSPLQN